MAVAQPPIPNVNVSNEGGRLAIIVDSKLERVAPPSGRWITGEVTAARDISSFGDLVITPQQSGIDGDKKREYGQKNVGDFGIIKIIPEFIPPIAVLPIALLAAALGWCIQCASDIDGYFWWKFGLFLSACSPFIALFGWYGILAWNSGLLR